MSTWRTSPLPPNWNKIRKQVLERDPICKIQGEYCTKFSEEVDHFGENADDHRLTSLRGVCKVCHRKRTSSQGGKAKAQKRPSYKRPIEKHPGLKD